MRLLYEIAIFQTVKSKVIISLFETVRLSVSISLRNLYNSLNSIKEMPILHGPVIQSIVSLTSSLRDQLAKFLWLYYQIYWYFLWKNERSFCTAKASNIFSIKYWHISDINFWSFNKTLTYNVISFEQPGPGPGLQHKCQSCQKKTQKTTGNAY